MVSRPWSTLSKKLPAAPVLTLLAALVVLGAAACGSQGPENTAPDFTLPDASGRPVALDQLLERNEAVVIVFYRGFG